MEHYLRELVSYKTISGNFKENQRALDYLEDFFARRGMHTRRSIHNGFESLIATTRPTKTPTLFLAAHLDVVTAPDEMFTMTENDTAYFGRGTFDMKSAIAAYMWLVDQLKDTLTDYDFGVMITTDEELGGVDGVGRLVDEGYLSKIVILPDGGDNWHLESRAKGIWCVKVTATGIAAHGSRPWEGDSATTTLLDTLHAIGEFAPPTNERQGTSMVISQLQAGEAMNQVPKEAVATIDFRFGSAKEQTALIEKVTELAASQENISLTTLAEGLTVEVDMENDYVTTFITTAESLLGAPIEPSMSYGASDARFFAGKGISCIVMQSTGGGRHANNEWLSKHDFMLFGEVLLDYVKTVCRSIDR